MYIYTYMYISTSEVFRILLFTCTCTLQVRHCISILAKVLLYSDLSYHLIRVWWLGQDSKKRTKVVTKRGCLLPVCPHIQNMDVASLITLYMYALFCRNMSVYTFYSTYIQVYVYHPLYPIIKRFFN